MSYVRTYQYCGDVLQYCTKLRYDILYHLNYDIFSVARRGGTWHLARLLQRRGAPSTALVTAPKTGRRAACQAVASRHSAAAVVPRWPGRGRGRALCVVRAPPGVWPRLRRRRPRAGTATSEFARPRRQAAGGGCVTAVAVSLRAGRRVRGVGGIVLVREACVSPAAPHTSASILHRPAPPRNVEPWGAGTRRRKERGGGEAAVGGEGGG